MTKKNESEHNFKQAEIKLAAAVTCHFSVMAIDNLNDIKDQGFYFFIFKFFIQFLLGSLTL